MLEVLEGNKPGTSVRIQLMLAATMWSVVGLALLIAGAKWTARGESGMLQILLPLSAGVGVLKALFVLRRTATRVVNRIEDRGDGTCIGGFFSWRTWVLVAVMVIAGRTIRNSEAPIEVVGSIYFAVGTALLVASVCFWRAWSRYGGTASEHEIGR